MNAPEHRKHPEAAEVAPDRAAEVAEIAEFLSNNPEWSIRMSADGSGKIDSRFEYSGKGDRHIGVETRGSFYLIGHRLASPAELAPLGEDQIGKLCKETLPKDYRVSGIQRVTSEHSFVVAGSSPRTQDLELAKNYGEYRKLRNEYLYLDQAESEQYDDEDAPWNHRGDLEDIDFGRDK